MKLSDFDYYLPESLIAQYPAENRTDSRLLNVGTEGALEDLYFREVTNLLNENDLLVRNNVKVMKARIFGQKSTGGKLEILLERVLDDKRVLAQIRASKSPKPGDRVFLADSSALVIEKQDGFYLLEVELEGGQTLEEFVEAVGHIPLPPYIDREDKVLDESRYQTVFAQKTGAVAAPTAGLHFDEQLFNSLEEKGVEIAELTLYVGSGTFQPVRAENIESHAMHKERIEVSDKLVEQVSQCKEKGGRVVALGTTTLRALESAASSGELKAFKGETDIFIYPGYEFRCVDSLITNFHLPKSTLLMLVSAFAGTDIIRKAYQHAIDNGYRFFSYGDAMFLNRKGI